MCVYRLPELLAAMTREAAERAATAQSGIPDIPAQSGQKDVAGALVPHTGHERRQVSPSPG